MEYPTFEDYLAFRCTEENGQVLDDEGPDFFDNWLSNLDTSEVIIYAQGWMDKTNSDIRLAVLKITN